MRTKVLLCASLMLLTTALNVVEAQEQELPISDKQNSGCLSRTRGYEDEPIQTIILTKEGSILSVEVQNFISNCATSDFVVKSSMSEGGDGSPCYLSINLDPVLPEVLTNCVCPFNVSFAIRDLEPNSFYLDFWWLKKGVKLMEGEPMVMAFINKIYYVLLPSVNEAEVITNLYTGDVEIPEKVVYDGTEYRVTGIQEYAFSKCDALTSVTIPNSVKRIRHNAFDGCTSLTSISIPNSVTNIEDNAFANCTGLTSLNIPISITSIEGAAFVNCTSLTSLNIPNSVTSIGISAFSGCKGLTSVTLPNSLPCIRAYAFNGCSGLTSIEIPNSVTSIEEGAFNGCSGLTSIAIPNSVTAIADETFYGCSSLTSVSIPHTVTSIGDYAFEGCSSLTSITIPNLVTNIGYESFRDCSSLTSVTIPNSVKTIGDRAFFECKGLTSIIIPKSVTDVGDATFQGCSNLTSVTIPNTVTSVGKWAFRSCVKLKDIYCWPDNVPSTEVDVFQYSNIGNATLHVPAASVSAYQAVEPWKGFKEIVELTNNPVTLYGEWWLVGWNDGGINYDVDPNYVSHRKLSIEIPREGSVMAYSMANEIFLGQLTLNGNEMIFGGEMQRWMTQVYYDLMENLFFEDHICDIKSYQLEGNLLKLYYTDNDYFVFTSDLDSRKETKDDYLPFVELGKQWHVVSNPTHPYVPCRFEKYEMYDKEEVDGKTYVRVGLLQEDSDVDGWEEIGLFREENRRVYKYVAGRDVLMYDFSLKEGDTFAYEIGYDEPVICKVMKQGWLEDGPQIQMLDSLTADGEWTFKYRKLRTWTIGFDNGSGDYNESFTWVESIGALKNMFSLPGIVGIMSCLAYLERNDEYGNDYLYLPFSLYNMYGPIYGCNMPKGAAELSGDWVSQYTYELEGDRLHVHGKDVLNCAGNYYAYFTEEQTDDPSVHKLHFRIKEVGPETTCSSFYTTDFYVPGFSPIFNYIVVDNQGVEHSVINKTPQDEYRPFVEEGKVWKVGTIPTDLGIPVQIVDHYYFDGDTIIDGKICKQMMCQHYTSPNYPYYENLSQPNYLRYVGAWYEENQKVYFYDERTQSMVIKYDFSLEANDTLQFLNVDGYPPFTIGPKQTGGIEGFKGIYRDVMMGQNIRNTTWLEGVGGLDAPFRNAYDPRADRVPEFLMSCTVGDEVIYLNDRYADGASPAGVRKDHFDFTHTPKIKPKTRVRNEEEPALYGEYNDQQLDINLGPLDDTYQVYITNESGKAVYEKTINAGNIVGLNIDISAYAKGRYTVTVENSSESFIGEFETLTTGIQELKNSRIEGLKSIYNLQGQRLSRLQKGLNIVNGRKIYVKD